MRNKKKIKALFSLLLTFSVTASMFMKVMANIEAVAVEVVEEAVVEEAVEVVEEAVAVEVFEATSGTCGDNLTWTLDEFGTLTISGTGDMWDWDFEMDSSAPWRGYCRYIKNVIINYGVTSIGDWAFEFSELTSIIIPSGVTRIGEYAFRDCRSLTLISIPDSVTFIGKFAFYGCESLLSISVGANNAYYCDINGVLFSKDKTKIHIYPAGKKETSYMIPEGVTTIGYNAFSDCMNLASISIPSSVTTIGYNAFSDCMSLASISIPSSVTYIGDCAFSCCALISISIPSSVTYIGENALFCLVLEHIFYGGSEASWEILAEDAGVPSDTKIHYNSVKPGTIIGSALRTNITATINGHAIPSFNVDGYTYIVAEDLKDYGFSVIYNNNSRTLALSRDTSKKYVSRSYVKPYVPESEVGIKEHDLVATDIVTYIDYNYAQSFNINGQTIIRFDELGIYGTVSYDNSTRIISVNIPELN